MSSLLSKRTVCLWKVSCLFSYDSFTATVHIVYFSVKHYELVVVCVECGYSSHPSPSWTCRAVTVIRADVQAEEWLWNKIWCLFLLSTSPKPILSSTGDALKPLELYIMAYGLWWAFWDSRVAVCLLQPTTSTASGFTSCQLFLIGFLSGYHSCWHKYLWNVTPGYLLASPSCPICCLRSAKDGKPLTAFPTHHTDLFFSHQKFGITREECYMLGLPEEFGAVFVTLKTFCLPLWLPVFHLCLPPSFSRIP